LSSPIDPIRTWRTRRLLALAAGAPALLSAALWSLAPIDPPLDLAALHPLAPVSEAQEQSLGSAKPRLVDASAFQVQLWNPPPEPISAQQAREEPPPTPPPNLELVAIIAEGDGYLAAIYEANRDILHIVGQGQRLERFEIVAVTREAVQLRDGARNLRLALTPAPPPRRRDRLGMAEPAAEEGGGR
jgi:hypothetical protein